MIFFVSHQPARVAACLLLTALAACNPLGAPKPADALYTLRAEGAPAAGAPLAQSIKIALPETAPGLESERIALLEAHRLNYYTGAAWAAPLPQSVQNLLADTFQRSGRFQSVGTDTQGISTDLTLLTEIRDWQVENGANPRVHLRLIVTLTRSVSRAPLATFPLETTLPASANRTDAIIAAFNRGANQLAQEAVAQSAKAAPPPLAEAKPARRRVVHE